MTSRATTERPTDPWERWSSVAVLAIMATGLAVLVVPPLTRFAPPCLFHEATGFYCPGCGSGRAASALLRLDIVSALRMNALAVLLAPVATYALLAEALAPSKVDLPKLRLGPRATTVLALTIIAFWVLRNVNAWPFEWLAPG